jgi:hypothetical protein
MLTYISNLLQGNFFVYFLKGLFSQDSDNGVKK